jgi:hypothetical protein
MPFLTRTTSMLDGKKRGKDDSPKKRPTRFFETNWQKGEEKAFFAKRIVHAVAGARRDQRYGSRVRTENASLRSRLCERLWRGEPRSFRAKCGRKGRKRKLRNEPIFQRHSTASQKTSVADRISMSVLGIRRKWLTGRLLSGSHLRSRAGVPGWIWDVGYGHAGGGQTGLTRKRSDC